jgi:hypothetical protein
MNIKKTLAACRAELARQQNLEQNAEIPDWAMNGYTLENCSGAPIARIDRRCDESTITLLPLLRNLNPARLRVAELMLNQTAGILAGVLPEHEKVATLVARIYVGSAAALLGVEIIQ